MMRFIAKKADAVAFYGRKIRKIGILSCVIKFIKRIFLWVFYNIAGIIAYPFCRITNTKFVQFYISSIGHLCVEPDCYIKEEIVGLRPKYNSIVFAQRKTAVNEHLLGYWKGYGIKMVESPILCYLLKPLQRNRFSGYDTFKYVFKYKPFFAEIQKRYHGRPPLLRLTDYDKERGWNVLESLGIPRGAWFVCVHCREDSYLGDVDQTNRNCNVNNYFPAINAITNRGGWVIRMGDSQMRRIPSIEHVIDYAHLETKCDWMDVFLSASCRFFLGSDSGLRHIATIFGVPGAIANFSPIGVTLSYDANGIGIPKLLWSVNEKRYFTFREAFDSSFSNYRFDTSFYKAGVRPEENSSQDIEDLAMEMLCRTEGKASYTKKDEDLQMCFKSLMNPSHYSYGAISRVGRDFLRKYAYLLKKETVGK